MKQFNIPTNFSCNLFHGDMQETLSIIEKNKKSFVQVYWYHDDPLSIYISSLYVTDTHKGLANELLNICEDLGRELGMYDAYLWVDKNTWMHDWYLRRGYVDYKDHDKEDFIWMVKPLKQKSQVL